MKEKTAKDQERVIQHLRERGFRVTKQRKLIISAILENECASCKEIYYQVQARDENIGIATVYRMLKTLEDAGLIDRRRMYRIDSWKEAEES